MGGEHRPHLDRLGLAPATVIRLERYLDLLAAWSSRVNLTGAAGPAQRVAVLVAPVVAAAPLVEGRLLDVGSGSGSPGLVLAALRPEVPATLLEPRARRWAFLREACRAVGRPDVEVLRHRHDTYSGPPASTVTIRALALPLPALVPLVRPGGRALIFGAAPTPDEAWVAEPSPRPLDLHVRRRT